MPIRGNNVCQIDVIYKYIILIYIVFILVYIGVSLLIWSNRLILNNIGGSMFNVPMQDSLRRTELVADLVSKHPTGWHFIRPLTR
jgi:hypothetical protein